MKHCRVAGAKLKEVCQMIRTKRALIASAAIAGLIAGSSIGIQASSLLPGLRLSLNAQDTPPDNKGSTDGKTKAVPKKAKEKHACRGQNSCKGKGGCKSNDNGCKGKNSCKGKGGCATDGSKMPEDKRPS